MFRFCFENAPHGGTERVDCIVCENSHISHQGTQNGARTVRHDIT